MFKVENLPIPVQRQFMGLWRRRWPVVTIMWLVAGLAWFAIGLMPNTYESRAHVYVEIDPAVESFGVRETIRQRVDAMPARLVTRPHLEKIISIAGLEENAERKAADRIKVERPSEMYLAISYRDENPQTAQAVVEAAVQVLKDQDLDIEATIKPGENQELAQTIENYEARLAENESAVTASKLQQDERLASKQASSPSQSSTVQSTTLRNELGASRAVATDLLNRLSATASSDEGRELIRRRIQLAELRSRHNDAHPDILTVIARIAQLETEIAASEDGSAILELQTEFQAAFDAVETLKVRQNALRAGPSAQAEALNIAEAQPSELEKLLNDQQELKTVYEQLIAIRDQALSSVRAGGVSYQVLEEPKAALSPSGPPRLGLIIGGLGVAVFIGIATGVVMTALDNRIVHSGELHEVSAAPVLGEVGITPSASIVAHAANDRARLAAACAALLVVGFGYAYLTAFQSPGEGSFFALIDIPVEEASSHVEGAVL